MAYLQSIAGQHTLTGQHHFPNTHDASTRDASRVYGKVPAIFGQDFGFAAPGDTNLPLASVQGRLTDDQWHDLITPGTPWYQHWCAQVFEI